MGKIRDRLADVRFHCDDCDYRFDAPPERVEDAPEDPWHPWRYFARCRFCKAEVPQEGKHRHLLKMWAGASGPKTEEGKEAVASNLKHGPEQTRRTRFNALKHGLSARTATFWPARPGAYPHCEGCEYRDNICVTAIACQKRTELFMQHHIAFETGDPRLLNDLNADLHANLRAIINDMIIAVIKDGARLKTPQWYYDKDGRFHWARGVKPGSGDDDGDRLHDAPREGDEVVQLYEISEHPLIKRIGEFVTRLGLSLGDMEMTPKARSEDEALRGFVTQQGATSESLLEFQERQAGALEKLGEMIARSRVAVARDPVLLEHDAGGDQNG